MGLRQYARKRKFDKTPEPAPSKRKGPGGRLFVVQKHDATNMHYDLRLELGGVLKSWAVPKGPSLDPADKRLAVHVEDHPIEYGDFEGTIPQGQYGGGTVMVWDTGEWIPEDDGPADYEAGKLKFRLEGQRLKGRWMLVRTRLGGSGSAKPGESRKENWLLFKERDEEAQPGITADAFTTSVKTGRTMGQIAEGKPGKEQKPVPSGGRSAEGPRPRTGVRRSAMPETLAPQLATPVAEPPQGALWLHEAKFDGYRFLAFRTGSGVRLLTRNGKDWSPKLPELCKTIQERVRVDAILDGEAVMLNSEGISDFQALQNSIQGRRSSSIVFFAFDLPWCDGEDLSKLGIEERRARLLELVGARQDGRLRFSEHLEGDGPAVFRAVASRGLEGIVSKRKGSRYTPGRSTTWLKCKAQDRQEFVIGGFTPPEGVRQEFGALLVGVYDAGEGGAASLRYSGRVGTGYSSETLRRLGAELRARVIPKCPFRPAPSTADARGATWIKPELVAEVKFREWTQEGLLRQPSFQGLRQDKDPREIRREKPAAGESLHRIERQAAKSSGRVRPAGKKTASASSTITITHPDRVVYPDRGAGYSLTKRQVADYYEAVAEFMLPHVAERALAIIRCPDGEGGHAFFQKHLMRGMPGAIRTVEVGGQGGSEQMLTIKDRDGLLGLVQMNALEIHPWGSRIDQLEKPDRLVFDLDPGPGVKWSEVVRAALLLRSALEQIKLKPFARTTGGKGLHVVVPIQRRATWDQAKVFCKAVATAFLRASPKRFVATAAKEHREGKIYIDYLRNTRGATAIGSYSTRARPGAPVATPLDWDEVTPQLDPRLLNAVSVPRRLESQGDPWRDIDGAAARLPAGI